MNFSNMYSENNLCPIFERSPDSQEHLPLCPVLQSILPLDKHIDYSHIHGSVEQQKEYVEVYKRYLEIRDELMDSSGGPSLPGLHAGPLRPQAARHGWARDCSTTTGEIINFSVVCVWNKLILSYQHSPLQLHTIFSSAETTPPSWRPPSSYLPW